MNCLNGYTTNHLEGLILWYLFLHLFFFCFYSVDLFRVSVNCLQKLLITYLFASHRSSRFVLELSRFLQLQNTTTNKTFTSFNVYKKKRSEIGKRKIFGFSFLFFICFGCLFKINPFHRTCLPKSHTPKNVFFFFFPYFVRENQTKSKKNQNEKRKNKNEQYKYEKLRNMLNFCYDVNCIALPRGQIQYIFNVE